MGNITGNPRTRLGLLAIGNGKGHGKGNGGLGNSHGGGNPGNGGGNGQGNFLLWENGDFIALEDGSGVILLEA